MRDRQLQYATHVLASAAKQIALLAGMLFLTMAGGCVAPAQRRDWPASVSAAVAEVVESLDAEGRREIAYMGKEDLISMHFGLGMWMRNSFGLWQGNRKLMSDCGETHPDNCSGVIIDAIWKRLRSELPVPERLALEKLETQIAQLRMPRFQLREVQVNDLAATINAAIAQQFPVPDRFTVRVDPGYAGGAVSWTDPVDVPFPEALSRLDANTFIKVRKQPPDLVFEPNLWPLTPDLPLGAVLSPLLTTDRGMRSESRELIADEKAWSRMWKELSSLPGWTEPQPVVDFSRNAVLVAALGKQRSGGYRISVEAHGARGGVGVFSIVQHEPGPKCMVTAVVTYPTHVYIIPTSLKDAQFLQGYRTDACD